MREAAPEVRMVNERQLSRGCSEEGFDQQRPRCRVEGV